MIDGRGPALLDDIAGQVRMRHIPEDATVPTLVYLKDCRNVTLKDFILRYPATKDDLYIIEGETVLKVKVPPARIENSLSPLYRGTDFTTLAETFQTVWGRWAIAFVIKSHPDLRHGG